MRELNLMYARLNGYELFLCLLKCQGWQLKKMAYYTDRNINNIKGDFRRMKNKIKRYLNDKKTKN